MTAHDGTHSAVRIVKIAKATERSTAACNENRAYRQDEDKMECLLPAEGDVIHSQPPIPGFHDLNSAGDGAARPASLSVGPTKTSDGGEGVGLHPTPRLSSYLVLLTFVVDPFPLP